GEMRKKKIIIDDNMQTGYYYLTESIGENFDPEFKPELTPKEMLELGIFGGKYMTDCEDEFPKSWFKKAKFSPDKKDISLNFFKVDASLSLKEWERKGWIHPKWILEVGSSGIVGTIMGDVMQMKIRDK
ncbi:MAG: hypothetical protein WAR82_01500, partial [Leptotrichiaceae bacterium]